MPGKFGLERAPRKRLPLPSEADFKTLRRLVFEPFSFECSRLRRHLVILALLVAPLVGCAAPMPYGVERPPISQTMIPIADPDYVWDETVDVVDNYFRIEKETRTKIIGATRTEGRIDTFPEISATLLEPWRFDVADSYDRLESTLQTIRRRALVRVIPAGNGYVIDVAVFKELEDLPKPEQSPVGAATFRNEMSVSRFNEPINAQPLSQGWISLGRDTALEQKILCKLQARFGGNVGVGFPGGPPCDVPPPGMLPPGAETGPYEVIPSPSDFATPPEAIPAPRVVEPPRQMVLPPGS